MLFTFGTARHWVDSWLNIFDGLKTRIFHTHTPGRTHVSLPCLLSPPPPPPLHSLTSPPSSLPFAPSCPTHTLVPPPFSSPHTPFSAEGRMCDQKHFKPCTLRPPPNWEPFKIESLLLHRHTPSQTHTHTLQIEQTLLMYRKPLNPSPPPLPPSKPLTLSSAHRSS